MTSRFRPFVRIQVDEASLEEAMNEVDGKLDRHEEMILELQRLLKDKADRSELTSLKESLEKQMNDRFSELNSRISELEGKFNTQLKNLESQFQQKLDDLSKQMNQKLDEKLASVQPVVPKNDDRLDDLEMRLKSCEDGVMANSKKISNTRESVEHIASGIAGVNNTEAQLDNTLPSTMKASFNYINDNFDNLFAAIAELKERKPEVIIKEVPQIEAPKQETVIIREVAAPPPPSPPSPRQVKEEKEASEGEKQSPRDTKIPAVEKTVWKSTAQPVMLQPDYDLSKLRPYPPCTVHWRDPPELPMIRQFTNMGDVVDYIYRLVPKLQGILNAMHGKVLDLNSDLLNKVDKAAVEKFFNKFQAVAAEMKDHIDKLQQAMEDTASRGEINQIVEDLFAQLNFDAETSIGAVKCIACGRDMSQVVGAMTEAEIARALGNPPNSIAFKGHTAPFSVAYSSNDHFDSAITESPKAIRPLRATPVKPKLRSPK